MSKPNPSFLDYDPVEAVDLLPGLGTRDTLAQTDSEVVPPLVQNREPQLRLVLKTFNSNSSNPHAELQVLVRRPAQQVDAPKISEVPLEIGLWLKRILDVIGASLLLLLTLPLMLIAALAVRFSSAGPVIIRQHRLTRGGAGFVMLKFRSMRVDAEIKSGAVWASQNDPRITFIGKIIRKTRIDELPQLINVLKGEMSLVGPRPERPEMAKDLRKSLPNFDSRLAVKAGLTGLAQVSDGYCACQETYRRKLAYDRLYIQQRSLLLDIGILFRTVFTVIFGGSGAR